MKRSQVLSLMVLVALTGCGRNAFVDKSDDKSKPTTRVEESTPTKGSVLAARKVYAQNINLGTVQIPVSLTLPLYLNNLSKDKVDLSISSPSREIEILKDKLDGIVVSNSVQEDVFSVAPSGIGPFSYSVHVKYMDMGELKTRVVEVSGIATQVAVSSNAKTELYRKDIETIDHGEIPAGSSAKVETVLKNTGINTAVVTSIKLLDEENFKLVNHEDSCLGLIIENCILNTKYTPTSAGEHSSHVQITYSDGKGDESIKLIPISGTANSEVSCVETSEVARFSLRAGELTNQLDGTILPYDVEAENSNISLGALYGETHNRQDSSLESEYEYVEDAQVISAIDLSSVDAKGSIVDIKLYASIVKSYLSHEVPTYLLTELLCIQDILSCSGNKFSRGSYALHNNNNYSVESDYFSKEILNKSNQINLTDGGLYLYERTMDLSKAFPQSKTELFSRVTATKSMKTIFADDIKLDSKQLLKVKYKNIKDLNNKCDN